MVRVSGTSIRKSVTASLPSTPSFEEMGFDINAGFNNAVKYGDVKEVQITGAERPSNLWYRSFPSWSGLTKYFF